MNHIKHYIKINNWRMAFRMMVLYIKLWWPVQCKCHNEFHRVQVMYWPRTAYHWNNKGIDPNGPMILCKDMADESIRHWDEMWSDYYQQVM